MDTLTAELTRILDGRWAQVRRDVRKYLEVEAERGSFDTTHLGVDAHRERVTRQLRTLAETEQPRLGFPTEYGGGGDICAAVVSSETLGFGDLSLMVKSGVQWGLFGGAVHLLGTSWHHDRYLSDIMSGSLLGCFAMTEVGHGSDVQSLRTTATYDPDTAEFVVHSPDVLAHKTYIGNAARDGRLAVVFAQLVTGGATHGVHALLVPIRDERGSVLPGVTIEDNGPKAGLNGVDNGRLAFDHVRVPRTALLNRYGDVAEDGTYSSPIDSDGKRFFTMLGTLVRGRISIAGSAGSATKRALTIAVRYAERRRQFAAPDGTEVALLDYLSHQRRLLPALATTYALHFAQEDLVARLEELQGDEAAGGDDRAQRELESRAAGLKAIATWHATSTIQTAREACGGAGYMAENVLPSLKADTDVFTTFEGDNTVLLQLVAKGLLTNYKHQFEDLSPLATVRFVAEQFVGAVMERTAARRVVERLVDASPAREDDAAVFDRAWQCKLFADREQHVLEGLARRLRAAARDDAFEVFNAAHDHVLRCARVHIERVVLDSFVAAVARCDDEQAKALLDKVCDLYVLSTIEADRAWFLEHGRLTSARAKSVIAGVNRLCRELRPHARTLVDAFAIPEPLVRVPMLDWT
ncbi:acyl-CoA dehydrogenase [Saccharomonospora viridis]|uniref:acyl-CoA oxidase n=1 Tax=Saccharomonospora viridis TaxID=1852 RepID=A0A837DIG2_9PSEU|nr:acyl-CoA dehydrogenase [Saccharomonospora viridis]KHF46134.1 acyl-CoA oxidase [Saccharomonospora viridis]SFP34109.1 Acyl-coenzyme A oxidase [Saccharomonospora viridis]